MRASPPPVDRVDDERRLVWLDVRVHQQLARAARARGTTVDALVEQLLAGAGQEGS